MLSSFCRHLRDKKMYVPAQSFRANNNDTENATDANAPVFTHCWCNKTMCEIGADDQRVTARDCADATRACYESR